MEHFFFKFLSDLTKHSQTPSPETTSSSSPTPKTACELQLAAYKNLGRMHDIVFFFSVQTCAEMYNKVYDLIAHFVLASQGLLGHSK